MTTQWCLLDHNKDKVLLGLCAIELLPALAELKPPDPSSMKMDPKAQSVEPRKPDKALSICSGNVRSR